MMGVADRVVAVLKAPGPNKAAYEGRPRVDRLPAVLAWSCSVPGLRELAIAAALSLPVPLLAALTPVVRLNFDYHDVFIPLDAAWRTLQGQWPHSDFYSPIGLAYFWLQGAAAWLFGMDGRVVVWADLLALPFVILPALSLAWRRLDALPAIALVVLLSALVTAPTFMDGPSTLVVHLADYNRIGGGLAALACLWALQPPRRGGRLWDIAETVLMGVVLLILLYLKVTFFGFSIAAAAVGCCITQGLLRRAALAGVVVAIGAIALEALHPGLLAGYAHDILRAGAANGILFRRFYVVQAILANAQAGVLLASLAAVAAWTAPGQRLASAGILVVAGGAVLVST